MATSGKKRKRGAKAKRVQDAKLTGNALFPTDEESIELRRIRAGEERAPVKALDKFGGYYGTYAVSSTQWPEPYRVEIRSLTEHINTCTCQDHQMNRLGTCKHIERVLQQLANRGKRRLAAAAQAGSPLCEIFLDERVEPARIRLTVPPALEAPLPSELSDRNARLAGRRMLEPFFGADGTLLADPVDAVPSLVRVIAGATRPVQRFIRVSSAIAPWVAQQQRRRERVEARAAFLEDVRLGKRTLDPVRLPLYPYQQEGMLHLAFGERAMLADEMGLGKTVQAIAACELLHQLRGIQRVLVVSPASLKAEWEDQIRQFTGRDTRIVYGPRAARLRTYREGGFFVLTNYEQVRGDVDDINRYLAPDVVILDEAQRIKNWPTRTAKTIKRLESPYAFVLTGTPLENRVEEIYSLVEFLDPRLFGSLFRFQREFFEVDDDGNIAHRNLGELNRRVNSIMLRRRKKEVEGELPERTVKTFFVAMADEQRARYDDYEYRANRLIAQAERRPLNREEFELLQRTLACMRMICDTPYILDDECRVCPKLEELESILDEVLADPSAKAIVFSEWVRMLELVKELAQAKGIGFAEHTGRVDQVRRRAEIKRFKEDPECRLFLSSEAGGTGLNLQVANIVLNLDLPWNPARLEQRIARAWRKHQTRAVSVINLVAENSIEHQMLGKLAFKARLAEAVIDGQVPEGDGMATGRGRKAFLQQVNALMGTRMGAKPATAEAAPTAEVPPTERLKQDLTARFPAQVLGVDASEDGRTVLVVARSGDDAGPIRRAAAAAAAGDARVEILDAETYRLLDRLREQGIIAFTGKTRTLFRSTELGQGTPSGGTTEAPRPVYREAALAVLETGARKRKMAQVLAAGELLAEALPPLCEAFDTAVNALHTFYLGETPEPGKIVECGAIPFAPPGGSLTTLRARLRGCDPQEANAPNVVAESLAALAAIDKHIRSGAASRHR